MMIFRTVAATAAVLCLSVGAARGGDGIVFAPSTQPASTPTIQLSALQNVRVVSGFPRPVTVGAITAFPLNSPPIAGFAPQVVFRLSDEKDSDIYSIESTIPGGNPLPGPGAVYRIATLDSGAQTHILSHNDVGSFNLAGNGLEGIYETTAVGANGSETVGVSDPMGIYATGFGNATSSGGVISVATTTFSGQYNVSVTTAQSGSGLPSVVGSPMLAMYRANIKNSQPKHLSMGTQTFRSPEVTFEPLSTSLPATYSKLALARVPAPFFGIEPFSTPAQYTPDFLAGTNHPAGPSAWYSLMASVNGAHTAGTFSGQQFLFDTGAQVTVFSELLAAQVGFLSGGENPSTPDFFVEVSGVGGSSQQVPGFYLNNLSILTLGGLINWTHVPIVVLNVPDPAGVNDNVAGILGMNLFTDRDLILNGIFPAQSGGTNSFVGISPQWQWNLNSGGSWNNAANWSLALPDGIDTQANFYGKITSAQTITVNSDVSVGTINFDNVNRYTIAGPGRITMQVSVDQGEIGVSTGSHTISAPMTLANDTNITVWQPASRLLISSQVTATNKAINKFGLGVLEMKNVRAGSLTINAGTVAITAGAGSLGTSRVSSLTIDTGTLSTAHLDLADHSLIVDNAVNSPLATIKGYLASGYNGGAWNGVGIDTSSGDSFTHALGIADNSVLNLGTFGGLSVSANAILIKFTWYGDANLDGMVTAQDLGMLASHWQQPANGAWTGGDFNYDGRVDIGDLYLLAINWQRGVGAPLGQSLGAALASFGLSTESVPEPATLGILASIFLASTARRIRRSDRL